jgi:hypothetical protein
MDKIDVLITGDFFGGNGVAALIDNKNYDDLFGGILPEIRAANISITNLESPLFDILLPKIKKTGPALRAKTNILAALQYAGFNVLTLANNHILDYGAKGLDETITAIEATNMDYVGVGGSLAEAKTIKYVKEGNYKVAIVNFCENEWSTADVDNAGANPLNPVENFYDIKEAKNNADKVIVIFHGGIEFSPYPSVTFKNTCRFFVDAGADAVVCHHTHFMSGYEKYNESLIFYGIGNFIFDNPTYQNHAWNYGYAVKLKFDFGKVDYELIPYKQCNGQMGVALLCAEEKIEFQNKLSHLNYAISNNEILEQELNLFAEKNKAKYFSYLQPYSNRILIGLFKRGLIPSMFSAAKYRLVLNIIRCESHHVVLKRVLINKTR